MSTGSILTNLFSSLALAVLRLWSPSAASSATEVPAEESPRGPAPSRRISVLVLIAAWRGAAVRSSIVAANVASAPAPRPIPARRSVAAASFAARRRAVLTLALALALAWRSAARPWTAASPSVVPLAVASAAIGRVRRTSDRLPVRAGHVRCLVALLADDDAEFDNLAVADRTDGFLRVVLDNGRLKKKTQNALLVLSIKINYRCHPSCRYFVPLCCHNESNDVQMSLVSMRCQFQFIKLNNFVLI